jgi:Eco57I restriction-modification methylase
MQGQLFTQDFLTRGITETPPWQELTDASFGIFQDNLKTIFAGFTGESTNNEAQTEALVINKVLVALGWGDDTLPQVNSDAKGRESVPDSLLFASPEKKVAALQETKDDRRYRHGIAILEAKRWLRPLDRGDGKDLHDPDAPSSQMLRYLSRVDVASDRKVKWGMLTNGAVWRLYWQDARSRSEEFFEVDVAAALSLPGMQAELDDIEPKHALKLFFMFFHRSAFLPQSWDTSAGVERTFHAFALNEARLYEEKVSQDLGQRVFTEVFPQLADALARGDLHAQSHEVGYGQFKRPQFTRDYLDEVRESALVLLYRLLFLFYAEDRNLLPVRDARYQPYSVRRLRERVRDDIENKKTFSTKLDNIWRDLQGVFQLIDEGDDAVGMPAYNGGLFDRARAPLLERTRVPDAIMAPIIDALSRRTEDLLHGWINYRDLSVSHLGGIYERLLEYTLVHEVQAGDSYKDKPEINRITAQPASFARKVSGSYYTHDDLVRLILRESVGLLAAERMDALDAHLKKLAKKASLNPPEWDALDAKDPAAQILELKICDPAMGSGHFLVALVDDLADRVLEAMNTATHSVNAQGWAAHLVETGRPWQSPLVARIAQIRRSIKTTAKDHGWTVTDAQLDDRHIVRRMILKKTIFGVDKNPMAVELAKTALWLHTFTVGAPLSFLDHHLKIGDSLHGEKLGAVQRNLQDLGALLLQTEFDRLALAAKNISQVADLTDVDIAEAHLSKRLASEAMAQVAPIHVVLDFWRALRWLVPGWPVDKVSKLAKILKAPKDNSKDNAKDSAKDAANPLLDGLVKLLDPSHNLVTVLSEGVLDGKDAATQAANELIQRARALAARETFFHWWTSFPTVFDSQGQGGFDAIIGNPPWDRIKLQEVEWFAERDTAIAAQSRAADRKRMVADLQKSKAPLYDSYLAATERAEAAARVLGKGKLGSGDYPLLGGGDVNLYSLFVERCQTLSAPSGIVALLTPSGIAADKGAAEFFRSISTTKRLGAMFDFENRKGFFPDVDSRFKFCTLVFGGLQRQFKQTRCAFYLHQLAELDDAKRILTLTAEDFSRVNPNTGAAPIFRNQRDADITLKLYAQHPVLVKHGEVNKSTGQQPDVKVWPVKYATMFHMTNDSHLFLKAAELAKQGYKSASLNRWVNHAGAEAVPLYEGKMVQMYDHRAADVVVNADNLHRAAQPETIDSALKVQPHRYPQPQFFVAASETTANSYDWAFGYKEISAPTNARSMIATLLPSAGFGNKVPLLIPQGLQPAAAVHIACLLAANFNSFAFDFVLRQKLQGQTINLFILEQLPVIAPNRFEQSIGGIKIADFIRQHVLALTYTAHDMAPFACDMGYVHTSGPHKGEVKPPFVWNDEDRRTRLAALDALFFYLYGLGADDAAYILDTFPIVRDQDAKAFGRYRTKDDVLEKLALIEAGKLA